MIQFIMELLGGGGGWYVDYLGVEDTQANEHLEFIYLLESKLPLWICCRKIRKISSCTSRWRVNICFS